MSFNRIGSISRRAGGRRRALRAGLSVPLGIAILLVGPLCKSGEAVPMPSLSSLLPPPLAPTPVEVGRGALGEEKNNVEVNGGILPETKKNTETGPVTGGSVKGPTVSYEGPFDTTIDQADSQVLKEFSADFKNAALVYEEAARGFTDPSYQASLAAAREAATLWASLNAQLHPAPEVGLNRELKLSLNECIARKQKGGITNRADALDSCQKDRDQIGVYHPAASRESSLPDLGLDRKTSLRLSEMLFLSNKEADNQSKDGIDPVTAPGSKTKSLKENFRLTSEVFCRLFGDVLIVAKNQTGSKDLVETQIQTIDPWTCWQQDQEKTYSQLLNRNLLEKLCREPVSLEVNRYCRAMYYYDLIKWMMQAQCIHLNRSGLPGPLVHVPMLPRDGQKCKSGNFINSAECQGPWGVTREDWDRAVDDLSLPGYNMTEKTAEAFFWAYRRQVITGSEWDGGSATSILGAIRDFAENGPMGMLTPAGVSCGALETKGGGAEFTEVVKNWKGRQPVWVKAAMRFANARALLWSRDLTMGAWGVVQSMTSSMQSEDLARQAKILLTAAFSKDSEATTQKQLEWTAKILEQLEREANLARKLGTGVVGNAG